MSAETVNIWHGQCLRKKAMTEKYANKVIEMARKEGKKLYKYWCCHCGRYHVTKEEQHNRRLS